MIKTPINEFYACICPIYVYANMESGKITISKASWCYGKMSILWWFWCFIITITIFLFSIFGFILTIKFVTGQLILTSIFRTLQSMIPSPVINFICTIILIDFTTSCKAAHNLIDFFITFRNK